MRMSRIPFHRVNWPTSIFLMLTLLVAITGVPLYLWSFGLDWFLISLGDSIGDQNTGGTETVTIL